MMDENLTHPPPISDGSIRGIRFSIATSKEIRTSSTNDCSITHHSQLMNPFLGLPLESGKCESCGTVEQGQCEGHFGFIELPTPVFHPCHVSQLKNILNLVCLKCLRVKKSKVRLGHISEKVKEASCPYCRGLPPISVIEVKSKDGFTSLDLKVPARLVREGLWDFLDKYGFNYGDNSCRPLLPYEVLEILKRLPEDTKRRLGVRGLFPQYGFILESIPVPPNCLYVPDISDGKSSMCNDTSIPMLRKILNKVDLIKRSRSGPPNFESHEIESNELQLAIAQYMHFRGTKKGPIDNSRKMQPAVEASQVSGKQWLEKMRSLFISKGSGFCSRSVLTGDAYKGTDEIGIPLEIAKRITFEERVTEWNLKRLQGLVDSRQCLRYKDGFSTYSTEEGSNRCTYLKVGQVVHRRIMDGDIVFVNRPPTTHKHALQAFSVYVHSDTTVKINPLICAPFGADFDGDCVHIFYPQSLSAKAEVVELFSVEQQLCSSHSGNLNLKLVNDSLLSLKVMHKLSFLKKSTAQQLAVFVSPMLSPPALVKCHDSGPLWTVLQIIQNCLPAMLNSSGERHLIQDGEILKADLSRESLQLIFSEVATSILVTKGAKDALKFVNLLQPLLMEVLFLEGFSISIRDFYVSAAILEELKTGVQEVSCVLHQLRLSFNELIYLQAESYLKNFGLPIVNFILASSSLGDLVDSSSASAVLKVVQQLGFIGLQLFLKGKLYSRSLVDNMLKHYMEKYLFDEDDLPSEAYGLIKSSFFHGLNPYEELVHSISAREVIVRSTRGLAEPGTLFKSLMAILRDVSICYDGTVRNICSNAIIQFEYEADLPKTFTFSPPGEPVGVLAATAISNPAYKAVLDSSQNTNSSWELMKEVLLSKGNFTNDAKTRRVILYLKDSVSGRMFSKEKAACIVQSCLRKVTLKECATDFSIIYENKISADDNFETARGLVGHIHLDKAQLHVLSLDTMGILEKCQESISHHRKKKRHLSDLLKKVDMSASECCSCSMQFPCVQFSCHIDGSGSDSDSMEKIIHVMANAVCPLLLDTIIKGDPRIHSASIIWVDSHSTSWVRKSGSRSEGEVAVEVVVEKVAAKRNGEAWRITMDSCLQVMHLIDTRRSIPYGIQQIQDLLGISCAFEQSVQRLSMAIRTVEKAVLKEHLMLVAHSMTCTGNVIGFNTSGYRALFRSLNIQVPFTEATLVTPMRCFERAAERCHSDSLSSIVASSLWGKNVAIGTGTRFQVIWNQQLMETQKNVGKDVYDFLHMVRETSGEMESSNCLGVDVDGLDVENGNLSPELEPGSNYPTFDDNDELHGYSDGSRFHENVTPENSGWEKRKSPESDLNGWAKFSASAPESDRWEKFSSAAPEPVGWETFSLAVPKSDGWETDQSAQIMSDPQDKVPAYRSKFSGWEENVPSTDKSDDWRKDTAADADVWKKAPLLVPQFDRGKTAASDGKSKVWEKAAISGIESDSWQERKVSSSFGDNTASVIKSVDEGWRNDSQPGLSDGDLVSGWSNKVNQGQHVGPEKSLNVETFYSWSKIHVQERNASNQSDTWGSWENNSTTWKSKDKREHPNREEDHEEGSLTPSEAPCNKAEDKIWNVCETQSQWNSSTSWGSWKNNSTTWKSKDKREHPNREEDHEEGSLTPSEAPCNKAEDKIWNVCETQSQWNSSTSWSKKNGDTDVSHASTALQADSLVNKNSKENSEGSRTFNKWNDNRRPRQRSQPPRSHGWVPNNNDNKNDKMQPDHQKNWTSPGIMTATGRRLDLFTSEEINILDDVEPIMQAIRKILHQSSYNDGDRLSEEDQKFIIDKVFHYHPDKDSKITGSIDSVMVDKHTDFLRTRCFYVVSTDGSRADFSYIKCIENFVKINHDNAEIFNKKYFRPRRATSESQQDLSQQE